MAASAESTAAEVIASLEGSAVVVEQTAVVKVQEALQQALRWLLAQHERQQAELASAAAARETLAARCEALEEQVATFAKQQYDGVHMLEEQQTQTASALKELTASSSAGLDELRGVQQEMAESLAATKGSLAEVEGRVALAEAANTKTGDGLEDVRNEALAAERRLRRLNEGVEKVENLATAATKRVNEVENAIDLRFLEAEEAAAKKLAQSDGRVEAVERRTVDLNSKIDAVRDARLSGPPGACQVEASGSAAQAIEVGDQKTSLAGRLGHVEWLLDALQGGATACAPPATTLRLRMLSRAPLLCLRALCWRASCWK